MVHGFIYKLQIIFGIFMFILLILYIGSIIFFSMLKDDIRGFSNNKSKIIGMRKLRNIKVSFYNRLCNITIVICIIEVLIIITRLSIW